MTVKHTHKDCQEPCSTLLVLQSQVDGLKPLVADALKVMQDLVASQGIQQEFNANVKQQLWDGDGGSRIQSSTNTANKALLLVKIALIPILLSIVGGASAVLWERAKSTEHHSNTINSKPRKSAYAQSIYEPCNIGERMVTWTKE